MSEIILPSLYFGNLAYFKLLLSNNNVIIDIHELYEKQTFRNRTVILTANGPQNLSVPVERPKGKNSLMSEVRISYAENWQKDHLRAIESAYKNTPYYIYYMEGLSEILTAKHELLINLNRDLTDFFIAKIGLSVELQTPDNSPEIQADDWRREFNPKSRTFLDTQHYIQTFEERHGFYSNPSIVDLLFNEGPNAISILQESKIN